MPQPPPSSYLKLLHHQDFLLSPGMPLTPPPSPRGTLGQALTKTNGQRVLQSLNEIKEKEEGVQKGENRNANGCIKKPMKNPYDGLSHVHPTLLI